VDYNSQFAVVPEPPAIGLIGFIALTSNSRNLLHFGLPI
jgi:hypothetical protein